MEKRRSAFILTAGLALALVLTSCGRKETAPQQASTETTTEGRNATASSSPSAAPDSRQVIVAFGDSLTAGVVEHPYTEYLQALLDKNGYQYRVENQGVSGDTTTDGLARIGNVLDAHPVLVILEFGGNDGLRGVPVEEIQKNLEDMIARLQQSKIPIALAGITLPPNYGAEYVKEFSSLYPALAKEHHLRYIPFLLLNTYQRSDLMQPDGIHPSSKGNVVVAQDVFNLVRPMLRKQLSGDARG